MKWNETVRRLYLDKSDDIIDDSWEETIKAISNTFPNMDTIFISSNVELDNQEMSSSEQLELYSKYGIVIYTHCTLYEDEESEDTSYVEYPQNESMQMNAQQNQTVCNDAIDVEYLDKVTHLIVTDWVGE